MHTPLVLKQWGRECAMHFRLRCVVWVVVFIHLRMETPLRGRSGGHTGAAPTHLHQTTRCVHTPPYCTFDSSKPRGVPLPHRGYTFDSVGLASATQPTLGNNASEEATPLGVVLFPTHCFLISSHTHNTSGAEMHRALPPPFFKTNCVYANWHRDDALLF